jgi:hypothetical protein
MKDLINRRDLLKLGGMGVAVFVSGTTLAAGRGRRKENESFYFVQLSDTHWGFNGPNITGFPRYVEEGCRCSRPPCLRWDQSNTRIA